MQDKTIIALALLIIIGSLQIAAFILGYNGQVLIITSNVFIGVLTYYFTKAKLK